MFSNSLFRIENKKVISFNIDNGEILWQTTLPEKYKELQLNLFSIVYQDTLVLSLGYDKLIGINTSTGKLEWK
ncbi:hypothetical protein SLH33_11085 [Tenacibaculum sp. IB213877]|nr:hypothetical protein [Tenacibaculum sp. IB213877]MDY0781346.1 hypothetical protein [Tenacibaculum sp. IB213877]